MRYLAILAIALILIASPAMADRTTQRPIQECVVIRQVGMVRNATQAEIARGIEVPCYLNDDAAVRYYFRKLHEREEEFCQRCCCAVGWEER